ncbi:hypothetical protein L1987_40454 [Smallanthus sonchifolius]|uniref:Uncharacterized protein n=1 Tax=Smallanthus sonchifolius TaxID=185202 RepID=A0ACB9GUA9_9ASTR|nr:hypothetical protein L1987_40454 [Smallanthus sonchifolius]
MANMVQVTNMLNYDNEIGTSQKPPKLLSLADYFNWKDRFDQFVSFSDTSLWIPILEGYTHPTYTWMGNDDVPKSVSALTTEEKLLFDREKKVMASISMSLPKEIYHSFKQFRTSQQLWEALQKRCEGSLDVKKSRKELLKKHASVVYETEEINDKFLEASPSKFDVYSVLIKENVKYKTMSLEEVLGKIQSHDLNMKKKETNMEHIQDPSMYFAKTSSKTGAGVAFFSGDTQDVSNDHCSGVPSHSSFSTNTTSSSSGTHNMNHRVADDYLAMFSSFMASYENFIRGKIHDPDIIEEDFRQIDPIDLEEMNIQWNMAMLMQQAKDFLKKTGRKYIGSNSHSRTGFDKTKKKPDNFQNNRNQSHGSSGFGNSNHASASSALVVQNDENYDWGIHLEDLVGTVSQAFVAEIHSAKSEESTDDDSSSDGESLLSADEEHDQVQNVESDIASGVSEDDIVLTQNSSDGADSENIPIAKVFMADMSDPSKKNKEISDKEFEVIKLHRKLENFENSSVVLDYVNANADPTKKVAGIGFVEGIPKEVKLDEPKVVKNVTCDRCILTEPDEVKVDQPKLSKMLQSSGFVAAGHQKKNSSMNQGKLKSVSSQQRVVTILKRPNVGKPTSSVVKNVPCQSFAKSLGFKQHDKHISKPVVFQNKFEIPHVRIPKDSQPEVKLSRPQRRRRNRKLKKFLEIFESDNHKSNNVFPINHTMSSLRWSNCESYLPKVDDNVDCELLEVVYFDPSG